MGAIDPFNYVTIASVCTGVFRSKYLTEDWSFLVENMDGPSQWIPAKLENRKFSLFINDEWVLEKCVKDIRIVERKFLSSPIGQVPKNAYSADNFNKVSMQWLEWLQYKLRETGSETIIQHALNLGEKRVILNGTNYKLDGYYLNSQNKPVALEFQGCLFHGCTLCFAEEREKTKNPLTHQSMEQLYALTQKKKFLLQKQGFIYSSIWECQFYEEIKANPQLRQFIDTLDIQERLHPRDSFFGGRTNAAKLYHKVQAPETIKYVDFTLLYPWTNKYCKYRQGHPELITKDLGHIKEYFGIAKVKILPLRELYHPVLPYRSNGKLKFPLCSTCADKEQKTPCECTDEERAIIGTWCTPEIVKAVDKGYTILRMYEVWHWREFSQYE